MQLSLQNRGPDWTAGIPTKTVASRTRGFTIVELVVIIGVIAILAGLLLPALRNARTKARIATCKMEMKHFETAILQYQSTYHRFPVSQTVLNSVNEKVPDFTFGTYLGTDDGSFGIMAGLNERGGISGTVPSVGDDTSSYRTCNAEIVAALCDLETYRNNKKTVNKDHKLNPQNLKLLSAKMTDGYTPGGIGADGLYRDPWGMAFIVTLDLNYDGKSRDSFYRNAPVSAAGASGRDGINGLSRASDSGDDFELNAPVMIWSFGPDHKISTDEKGNAGVNKDNVLSWR